MVRKWIYWLPIILIIMVFYLWVTSYFKVRIQVDDKVIEYWTLGNTVEDVISELNLNISQFDNVSPALSTSLQGVKDIDIKRAHEISLYLDGQVQKIITPGKDVEEVLRLNGVILNPLDIVQPVFSTKATDDLAIRITRVKEEIINVNEEIPYDKEYKNDKNLWKGETKITTKGKTGLIAKTYLVRYHDNQEVNREVIAGQIIKEPTEEIILKGTKQTVEKAGKEIKFSETLVLKSTAYTHTGEKTYTGVWPKRGTVAVDPRVIPLGTRLYIDGYGFAIAQDIGSAIKGKRIDLFMENESEALRWGWRSVRVFILK